MRESREAKNEALEAGGDFEVVEAFDVKSRFSGSVNMQVVMRVNAEQASKRLTQKPTRPKDGEGRS